MIGSGREAWESGAEKVADNIDLAPKNRSERLQMLSEVSAIKKISISKRITSSTSQVRVGAQR